MELHIPLTVLYYILYVWTGIRYEILRIIVMHLNESRVRWTRAKYAFTCHLFSSFAQDDKNVTRAAYGRFENWTMFLASSFQGGQNLFLYVTVSDGQLTTKTEVYVTIKNTSGPNGGHTRWVEDKIGRKIDELILIRERSFAVEVKSMILKFISTFKIFISRMEIELEHVNLEIG